MSDFIRPELKAAFWRFRDVIAGAVTGLAGVWMSVTAHGWLVTWGYLLIALGCVIVGLGWQRARFRTATGGLGMVDVDEGQITYFGPLTGGTLALHDVTLLVLERDRQTPHWKLVAGKAELYVPLDAAGSDELFDAFTALPGLKTERMLSAMQSTDKIDVVIWSRGSPMSTRDMLH